MMSAYFSIKELIDTFFHYYFVARDIEGVMGCVSEDVRFLGAIERKLYVGTQELRVQYNDFLRIFGDNITYTLEDLDEYQFTDNITVWSGNVRLFANSIPNAYFSMRLQLMLRQYSDGSYLICSINASVRNDSEKYKHIESKIERFKQQFELLVNLLPGGVAIYKFLPSGKAVLDYYSAGICEITGHTSEEYDELIKKDIFPTVFAEDYKTVKEAFSEAVSSQKPASVSYRRVHKDGSLVWVTSFARVDSEADGHLTIYVVTTNASKRFRLQQKILDEIKMGITVRDKDTYELYYANDASFEMFNIEKCGYHGKKCYEIFLNRETPCKVCCLSAVANTGKSVEVSCKNSGRTCVKDIREIGWMGRPAYIEYGSDVTDIKNARDSMYSEQERYRVIVESSGMGIADWDAANKQFYFSGISKYYAANHYSKEQMAAFEFGDEIVHQCDIELMHEFKDRLLSGELNVEKVVRVRMNDDTYRWTAVTAYSTVDDGKIVRLIYTLKDVDDEKNAELTRLANMQRMNLVIEDAGIYYCEYNITEDTAILSKRSQRELDLPQVVEKFTEHIIKQTHVNEKHAAEIIKTRESLLNGSTYEEIRMPVVFPNGKMGWVLIKIHTVLGSNNPMIAIGTAIDVSEQAFSEQRYYEMLEYQKRTAAEVHNYFACNLTDNKLISALRLGEEIEECKGLTFDELFSSNSSRVIGEKKRKEYIALLNRQRLLDEFEHGIYEKKFDAKFFSHRNDYIWLENTIVMMKNPETDKVMIFITAKDITGQKMLEETIYAVSKNDFDLVANLNIFNGTITLYKRNVDKLDHLQVGELLDYDMVVEELSKEMGIPLNEKGEFLKSVSIETIVMQLLNNSNYQYTVRTYDENNNTRMQKIRFADYDIEYGTVLFTRMDVTDVLVAQEQQNTALVAALDSARHANEAKTTFLSSMSHDMRTPMNAIVGMTNLALDDLDNKGQVRESFNIIKDASSSLLSLINDVLDMSRIESGNTSLTVGEIDQSAQLEKLYSIMRPAADNKGIKLCIQNNINNNNCISDHVRLSRVLENIVANAIKFTPQNGSVTIYADDKLTANPSISIYRYVITDTGMGMNDEQCAKIFEPFYRTQQTVQSCIEGTGLGLSIVNSMLELMGGSIDVESETGKGTTFTVQIPMKIITYADRKADDGNTVTHLFNDVGNDETAVKANVLLVEDHPVNALVATKILNKLGAATDVAENGKMGLEKFEKAEPNTYDIIFMDIRMPVMDGYEATRRIRASQHPQAETIPIIAMSANAFNEDIELSLKMGMNDHLAKPIDTDKLKKTLQYYCSDK